MPEKPYLPFYVENFQKKINAQNRKNNLHRTNIKTAILGFKSQQGRFPTFNEALGLFDFKDKRQFRNRIKDLFKCSYDEFVEFLTERPN